MRVKVVSSLEKCFPDESIAVKKSLKKASMLRNERYSFQLCYQQSARIPTKSFRGTVLQVDSPIRDFLKIRKVQYVPVLLPVYHDREDSGILRTQSGLFPDPLAEMPDGRVQVTNNLNALWIDIEGSENLRAGVYPITLRLMPESVKEEEEIPEATVEIEVIDALLPPQTTKFTQWFHCDCLQVYYGTQAFDERHWQIIENFMTTAVKNGLNMILTPLLTPPLDTQIGGERPTVQLVDIKKEGDSYSFDFSKLERWVKLCDKVGIRYFEINHLFTQWGAEKCPKVVAEVNGEEKRIFGWDTPATGEEYKAFLSQLIPAFLAFMKGLNGADKRCYFHISDEPSDKHLDNYIAAREVLLPLVEGYPVMDALSHVEYYDRGLVSLPVPYNGSIGPFLERDIPERWTYYACGMKEGTSNRYLSLASQRNRIIGAQMYKYNVKGFLHWGYNFYFSQLSRQLINPWICTDGESTWPSGDPFSVYPGPHGACIESLRLKVFYDALQDQRALEKCEELCGREYTLALLEEGIDPLEFDSSPCDPEYILRMRERVNAAIKAKV